MSNQELFIKYIRTKQFFTLRLKEEEHNPYASVYISSDEIEKRFFPYPKYDKKAELKTLVQSGQIEINRTNKFHLYKALKAGGIDISLIRRKPNKYDAYTRQIKDNLQLVTLPELITLSEVPIELKYFESFIKHRKNYIDHFFTVDNFSGRVHTPVVSLKKEYRINLLLNDCHTTSLDVAQMQPTLLGKILQDEIADNEFSRLINEGKDIYIMLQDKTGLPNRDAAKKYFYKITFGKPDNELRELFGAANWVSWINDYKSRKEPRNRSDKIHSNLAWLLQNTEVQTMRKVWKLLIDANIIFCSVHDEIIVMTKDATQAKEIMSSVLSETFAHYKIN